MCILVASWIAFNALEASMKPEREKVAAVGLEEEMNGRLFLGLHRMDPSVGGMLLPQLGVWETGTPEQRLAYVVMVSELDSPESGLEQLQLIHEGIEDGTLDVSEGYGDLLEIVGMLLFASAAGEQAEELPTEQRELLQARLGIFADVLHASATNDEEGRQRLDRQLWRAAIAFAAIAAWFVIMGLGGIAVLAILGIMLLMGKLRLKFRSGNPTGSVYMETFAAWLLLFFGFNLFGGLALAVLAPSLQMVSVSDAGLLVGLIGFLLSLFALFWPILRGISFKQMCEEVGLTWGRPVIEVLAGVATYAAALPLLIVGVICFLLLSVLAAYWFGEAPQPSHPITEAIGSSVLSIILLYLVACVAAPIVEETMFRGVLYRYLRNSTTRVGWILSFLASALFSSLVFAMIHPQGFLFIPVLGALAVAFCIGREWRGSLIAPMVAHGLSNAVVMTLNVVLAA